MPHNPLSQTFPDLRPFDPDAPAFAQGGGTPPLRIVNAGELASLEIAPRATLLAPLLLARGLAMVHGWRGIGKTHFVIGCAVAMAAGGSFLRYKAPAPCKVLLIDGEMPAATLKERIQAAALASPIDMEDPDNLRILAADLQTDPLPDLGTPDGQAAIAEAIAWADVVILDNLSSLIRSTRDNDSESWQPVQDWLLRLRRDNKSVLLVHHSGKSGAQRGTSRKEDVLDVVIGLRRPANYSPVEGARFEVYVEKGRHLTGADAEPFEAMLTIGPDGSTAWAIRSVEDAQRKAFLELIADGTSVPDASEAVGISRATGYRWKKSHVESASFQ
jgi:putative DNA primase/helicase